MKIVKKILFVALFGLLTYQPMIMARDACVCCVGDPNAGVVDPACDYGTIYGIYGTCGE